jgi:hypothetical protein
VAQVDTWDYPNRRFYLSFDTVSDGIDFILAYAEERAYRRLNESARKFLPMLQAQGNIPKGGGRFTPRYTVLLDGARPVPYDTSHTLTMLTEPITDDELSGAQVFDRLPLSNGVEVNVDVGYSQVEIITVATGDGGFTSSDRTKLNAAESYSKKMASQLGLVPGVTATHSPTQITTSDGQGSTTISDNGDGSYTVAGA